MFKGLGNLANIGALMKQAQEMGGKMQALQEELKTKRATGAAGGGLVEVEVNGLGEVLAVRIDPSLVEKAGPRNDRRPAAGRVQRGPAKGEAAARRRRCSRSPAACRLPGLHDALSQFTGSTARRATST